MVRSGFTSRLQHWRTSASWLIYQNPLVCGKSLGGDWCCTPTVILACRQWFCQVMVREIQWISKWGISKYIRQGLHPHKWILRAPALLLLDFLVLQIIECTEKHWTYRGTGILTVNLWPQWKFAWALLSNSSLFSDPWQNFPLTTCPESFLGNLLCEFLLSFWEIFLK